MNKLYGIIAIIVVLTAWSSAIWRIATNLNEAKHIKLANNNLIVQSKIISKSEEKTNVTERITTLQKESAISILQYRDRIVYRYSTTQLNESQCNKLDIDTFDSLNEVLR